MSEGKSRARSQEIMAISLWTLVVNALLAALKIAGGLAFSSLSLLGDGIDSLGDVLASLSTVLAARALHKPPDADHPWGHDRADTLAAKFINFFIFFAGAQLLLRAMEQLLNQEPRDPPSLAGVIIAALSVAVKGGLAWRLRRAGKRQRSTMLEANAINMSNDVLLSAMVLLGVGLSAFLSNAWVDVVAACGVSLWVIAHAILGFRRTDLELMDGLRQTEMELYERLFKAVDSIPGVFNPHRVRIRRFADRYLVDLDVEMDGELSLREAHQLGCLVEAAIRQELPSVYDIMLHLEPKGNEERECFGLRKGGL